MKWRDTSNDWKKRFAYLPFRFNGWWYWWVPYWVRNDGDSLATSLTEPEELKRALDHHHV